MLKRDSVHHVNEHGLGPAKIDKYSNDYAAIRGREEQLIQRHGGPQAYGGSSANKYSGISDKNPKRDYYLEKASEVFGKLKSFWE